MGLKVGQYVLIAMFGGLMMTGGSLFISDLIGNYNAGSNFDTTSFSNTYSQIGQITNTSTQLTSTVQNAAGSTLGVSTAIINGLGEVIDLIFESVGLIFIAIGDLFNSLGLPISFGVVLTAIVGVVVTFLIIGLIWGRDFL